MPKATALAVLWICGGVFRFKRKNMHFLSFSVSMSERKMKEIVLIDKELEVFFRYLLFHDHIHEIAFAVVLVCRNKVQEDFVFSRR